MTLLFAFLIGLFGGLRSLTAPAATAWAAHLGWLKLERPLSLIGSLPAVVIFTLLALAELVADKLPKTPNRTSLVPLTGRILMGALTGACVAVGGGQTAIAGALVGAVGGVVGAATALNAKNAGIPDNQIVMFPDFVSAVAALKACRVDGALQTAITAATTVKSSNDPTIERALPFEQAIINGKPTINYAGFAMRPEDKDLLAAVNAEPAQDEAWRGLAMALALQGRLGDLIGLADYRERYAG